MRKAGRAGVMVAGLAWMCMGGVTGALGMMEAQGAAEAPWEAAAHKSVSRTQQFVIYADDPNARATIAMNAEDTKEKFLRILDARDGWKRPIIIQITPLNTADPSHPASDVLIVNTVEGFKVVLNVFLGPNPREARYPQQLMRSILLEFAYRNQAALVNTGAAYAEPPQWLVYGLTSLVQDEDSSTGSGLFRSLIESGKTPTLGMFLSENPSTLDSPSLRLYSACAMSLVKLLTTMPGGREEMQNFIRRWPGGDADPEAELLKAFPGLNTGSQSLEKWWTLGLASLSAADRYQGMSLAETSQGLDDALKLDVAMDKAGKTRKMFAMQDYAAFAKAPGAEAALNDLSVRLLGLEGNANPLMRDVIAAYQTIAVELLHHKSSKLQTRLAAIGDYRKRLADHMDQIADYMNWYEATQRKVASGSFDEYIKTADELDKEEVAPRGDPISKYMDSMEKQLAQ